MQNFQIKEVTKCFSNFLKIKTKNFQRKEKNLMVNEKIEYLNLDLLHPFENNPFQSVD